MQSLTDKDEDVFIGTENNLNFHNEASACKSDFYSHNHNLLKGIYHSQCLFNRQQSFVPGLRFWFDNSGVLHGEFNCNGFQQGYDNMVHGGVISAIIDASMAQCLMGHGIVGYTTDLSVKYRKPVMINTPTVLKTEIVSINCKVLYIMKSEILQNNKLVVQGNGRFYKVRKY